MAAGIVRQNSFVPTKVHAAIYARVSTLNGGQDPTLQKRELKEYCQQRGWQVFARRLDVSVDSVFPAAKGAAALQTTSAVTADLSDNAKSEIQTMIDRTLRNADYVDPLTDLKWTINQFKDPPWSLHY